jgi:putative heme-binding domain-containing protein
MLESYQLVTVATRDGRTLSGNVAAEDDRQLTLRLVGQDTTIAKSEIVSREKSSVSLMPEGLLEGLANEQAADLLAYLQALR